MVTGVRARWRGDDGANAVEFALVLPLLVLLLFGAITFGLAFNQKQQLEHANREAVRFAATLPDPGTDDWFEEVFQRIVVTAAGQAPVWDPGLAICVSVDTSSAVISRTRQGNAAYTTAAQMAAGANGSSHCVDGSLTGSTAQVTISRDARLDAVFFRDDITLQTHGVALYEETD